MDLVKLTSTNQQGKLIENYDSLIWTERYRMGDFQLITGNVDQFIELLPEGSVVSLRESTVPMIVERHVIDRKKNTGAKLTIIGRDFCSVLDRRVSIQDVLSALAEWLVVAKIPSDVAHYIIYRICVVGILDPKDIFPPSQFQLITPSDYLTTPGPNRQWSVARGKLLDTVLGLLAIEADADPTTTPPSPKVEPHGIRAIRPSSSGTAIGMEIYKGTDRSATVRFEGTRDMLDDGTYLFSKEGSANGSYVIAPTSAFRLNQGPAGAEPSGFDRRVILTESESNVSDAVRNEGTAALGKAHETARFDGAINQQLSPYTYGVDYRLGDIVNLIGDYGLETKARVTEYIRSEDAAGSRSYPTLEAITPEGEV